MPKLSFWIAILFIPTAFAEVSSGPQKVHLLELFSTQSCHSCPPAQEWISSLKKDPKVFKSFIPVVYHVDYWDYLGWKDPYSSPKFTRLQKIYYRQGSSKAMYTPMFAHDGKEWRKRRLSDLKSKGPAVGNLKLTQLKGFKYRVEFEPTAKGFKTGQVFAVLQGSGITTQVNAGENRGKSLKHDFLTLQYKQAPLKKEKSGLMSSEIEFEAVKAENELSVVFWVSPLNRIEPLQSVGTKVNHQGAFTPL